MSEGSRFGVWRLSGNYWMSARYGGCLDVSRHQVRTGQVRTAQVRTGQVRTGQVRTGQVRTGQVSSVYLSYLDTLTFNTGTIRILQTTCYDVEENKL